MGDRSQGGNPEQRDDSTSRDNGTTQGNGSASSLIKDLLAGKHRALARVITKIENRR